MMRRGAAAWRRRTLIPPAPSAINGELPGGAVNETYAEQLTASPAGALPVVWTISSGALPPGWELHPSTGAIGGVATSTGSFTFTVRATNLGGYVERSFTLRIGTLVALLHCNEANGSTSTVDATDGGTFTRSGTNVISTAQAKFGTASMQNTGNGRFSRTKAGFAYGTGDFMIDFWARPDSSGVQGFSRFLQQGPNSTNGGLWIVRAGTSNPPAPFVQIYNSGYINVSDPGPTIPNDTWSHIALGREGTQWYFFLNGVSIAAINNANNITQTDMYLGGNSGSTEEFNGFLDEIRVMAGACRWRANFTPPTAPSDFPVVP